MNRRRLCILVLILCALLVLAYFGFNVYLLLLLVTNSTSTSHNFAKTQPPIGYYKLDIKDEIISNVANLPPVYLNVNPRIIPRLSKILSQFVGSPGTSLNAIDVWRSANQWPKANQVYPKNQSLTQLIGALQTARVMRVENSAKGTQLKLNLLLEGNQMVIFKPKWYERAENITGNVYSGKDRHNSEIVAFYLGALLELNWTPIAVGRRFNAKDLYSLSDDRLRETFTITEDDSYCFYGICYYCNANNMVCGYAKDYHSIEGVLLYLIPGKFNKRRSPWQRTYKDGVAAEWELNGNYCRDFVLDKLSEERLLDLVDSSIFDFLIQNGDRHHYETRDGRLLLLDNGKGFGDSSKDYVDILAPLYQCCKLRRSTKQRLSLLTGGQLSKILKKISQIDLLYPILTESHFVAIERRLLLIWSAIDICWKLRGDKMYVD